MITYLPFVVWLALLIAALVDISDSAEAATRVLAPHWWILLVAGLPIIGAAAWFAVGRPRPAAGPRHRAQPAIAWGDPAPLPAPAGDAPADGIDSALRAELERIDADFEQRVRRSRARHPGGQAPPSAA